MFIETSEVNPGVKAVTRLPSSVFSRGIAAYSMTFSYHMYGQVIGTLELKAQTLSGERSVFSLTGNQGTCTYQQVFIFTF